jgi:spore maturation protein CgeB
VRVVLVGLSVTSSWGNGHATNYRALMREIDARGHEVLFLERDVPWYAANRDLPNPPWGQSHLYSSLSDLRARFADEIREADLTVVGSYVPDGVAVGEWVSNTARGATAFYDIDTPVTLARLDRDDCDYLSRALIPRYDLYLSFTGGPTLDRLERIYGARKPCAFYCLIDPDRHRPRDVETRWDMGYLGTYSADRQPQLEALLLAPAQKLSQSSFVVAGAQYPREIAWPANVGRLGHVPPAEHPDFYAAQRFALNVTRADMRAAGWSPSVRLFEAAACGVPVISDRWDGLEDLFAAGSEIVIADTPGDVITALSEMPEPERREIGARARRKVLADHTASRRIDQLESLLGAAA